MDPQPDEQEEGKSEFLKTVLDGFSAFTTSVAETFASSPQPDKYKTFFELVSSYDYPIEQHFYETEDGYLNRVFRISGPKGTSAADNAKKAEPPRPVIVY